MGYPNFKCMSWNVSDAKWSNRKAPGDHGPQRFDRLVDEIDDDGIKLPLETFPSEPS